MRRNGPKDGMSDIIEKLCDELDEKDKIIQKLERQLQQCRSQIDHYKAKEEKERQKQAELEKIMTSSKPVFFQDKIPDLPPFSKLHQHKIFLLKCDTIEGNENTIAFYAVHHTARFETVNLDFESLEKFKAQFGGTVIVLAITPGDVSCAKQAPSKLANGNMVVTLFYRDNAFVDEDNEKAYKKLQEILYSK